MVWFCFDDCGCVCVLLVVLMGGAVVVVVNLGCLLDFVVCRM